MKISKQLNKLKNLNVEAEKCSTREEAKKIINKANKAQSKINKSICSYFKQTRKTFYT